MSYAAKGFLFIWAVLFLVIPITQFAYGVKYSSSGKYCRSFPPIYACLIGGGLAETLLLCSIMCVLYYGNNPNEGNDVVNVVSTTTYRGEKIKEETKCSYTDRCITYTLTVVTVIASAGFFFTLHGVFTVREGTQFTNSSSSTFCEKELYQAAFGLTIASYFVGIFLIIFAIILCNKYG